MNINLSELSYKDKIEINEIISYPLEYLENSPIKKLENVIVNGYFYQNDLDEYICKLSVEGNMTLLDSVTLDEVLFPFSFEIDENIEQVMEINHNLLDLMEFLWQNIILEVPIRYTKSDADNLSGDNWQVINGDEEKIDPRMQKLYDYYKGGE